MDIIRKELTPAELQNPNSRYNPDCDCTQTTIDGGATWQNNPGIDPRTSAALLLPAPSTSDPRCDSATGITANFRDGLTQALANLNTTGNAFAGASVILTILDFLDGIGLIIQLFIDFCTLILGIGVEAVAADFTDSVYAQFACNLYCDCKPDGTFDAAAFDQLLADNASSFGEFSTVNIILNSWLNGLGFVGLSNVGSIKRTSGDCSDCNCRWCYYLDFTVSDQGFSNIGVSTWVSGQGWQGGYLSGTSQSHVNILGSLPALARVTSVTLHNCKPSGSGGNNQDQYNLYNGGTNTSFNQTFGDPTIGCPVNTGWDLDAMGDSLELSINTGTDPTTCYIQGVKLQGFGDNPFGTNNC